MNTTVHFDPAHNVGLDESREATAATVGDQLLETVGLKGRVFFDEGSGKFWMQDAFGEWRGRKEKTFEAYLKRNGINAVRDDKAKMSDLDLVMLHISLNCAVAFAGPIAGYSKGVIENNGQTILVTRSPRLPVPTPGEFPVLMALIDQQFGPQKKDQEDQRPYLYAWWKYSIECILYGYDDNRGLAMMFAGPAGCGKSLLATLIRDSLGGRHCEPYDYMSGNDKFNGEFIGSELWLVDDEQALTDRKSRSEYAASLKKIVAKQEFKIRGMQRESIILKMFRRSLTTVNDEPDKITVIPPLDDDIIDKVCILLSHGHPMPMPAAKPAEKKTFWATLCAELPHLMYWLLEEYNDATAMDGRFGSAHYCHPRIKQTLYEMSAERVLWEQIEKTLNLGDRADNMLGLLLWEGTATDLRRLLLDEDSPLNRSEKNNVTAPSYFGRYLAKIAVMHPDRLRLRKSNGKKWWQIVAEETSFDEVVSVYGGCK